MKRTALFRTISAGLALGVTTLSAYASEEGVTSTIAVLRPLASGYIQISVAGAAPGCTNQSVPKRFLLKTGAFATVTGSMTAEGLKNIYASLLYASSLDRTVSLYFDNGDSNCVITRVAVMN